MQIEVMHGPANAVARVRLEPHESFTAEAGAMIAMSGQVGVTTTTLARQRGGVLKAMRRLLAGESLFLNHFQAEAGGGEVWVAPTLPGDVATLTLEREALIVQGGAFLAASPKVELDLGWQGLKSLFSGESLFWLKLSGQGQVVVNSFGAIYPIDVDGEVIVDTGHVVAFGESLKFSVTKASRSWLSTLLGGEGLVLRFAGKGRIWCQSHSAHGFGLTLGPKLKPRKG